MTQLVALDNLITSLDQLVKILAHDPGCQWHRHFERCLAYAQALKAEGFTATELNDLSSQIRSVYGGMGSFTDYAPVTSSTGANGFAIIAGMENFDAASQAVYQHALALDSANAKKKPWAWLELKIPPVILVLLFRLAMRSIAHLLPALTFTLPGRTILSAACLAIGCAIAIAGVLAFRKADTTVNPTTPEYTSSMVMTGIYAYTRNPMYLGMLLVLLAFAVWLAHTLAFLFLPLFVLYMNRFQIQPEERFLSSYFVLAYPEYQAKVRRWL